MNGISRNTSEAGCFGKLSFSQMSILQGNKKTAWEDAGSFFARDAECVMSIDTVALAISRLRESVWLAACHTMNDIYAAGGKPTALAASFLFEDKPSMSDLQDANSALNDISAVLKSEVTKLHSSWGGMPNTVTISAVGMRRSHNCLASENGSIYLLDGASLRRGDQSITLDELAERVKWREDLAELKTVVRKDISGDGLAGSCAQIAASYNLSISLSAPDLFESFVPLTFPADSCRQDRNYADFADSIIGFSNINSAMARWILFEPQFFGPIMLLLNSKSGLSVKGSARIGSFKFGSPRVEICE